MGILGKIGKVVGKIGKIAAPIAAGVIGGPLAGALVGGGLNAVTTKGGLGKRLGAGALGAASGYGAGKFASLAKAKGIGGALKSAGGSLVTRLKKPGGGLDLGRLAELGLAGGSLVAGAKAGSKAGGIREGALRELEAERAMRAPLRQQFMSGLRGLPSEREDLGSMFASESPFARVGARPPVPTSGVGPPIANQPPGGGLFPIRRRLRGQPAGIGGGTAGGGTERLEREMLI